MSRGGRGAVRLLSLQRRAFCSSSPVPTFVSTSWLQGRHESEEVRVLAASWSACEDFALARIPAARCFDGLACRDKASPYKHALPSAEQFQETVRALGVKTDSHVVVYDHSQHWPSLDTAPRLWFLFRRDPGDFKAVFTPKYFRSYDEIVKGLESGDSGDVVVDTRSPEVFAGEAPEPFGRPGHLRGAVNVPIASLLDAERKGLRSREELEAALGGLADTRRVPVAHCNAGLSACVFLAAWASLGAGPEAALFDGSWCEVAARAPPDAHWIKAPEAS